MGKSSIGTKNYGRRRELNMKKYDLQFFAEEAEAVETEEVTEQAEETQEVEGQAETEEDDKPELKYSDEDVDRIISQKFAKWQEDQEAKINEAKKLEKMNAEEKAEYERQKLEDELAKYKAREAKREMLDTAKGMFGEQGIANLPDNLVSNIIAADAETTKKNVESFTEMFNSAVQLEVDKRLAGKTPKKYNKDNEKDVWGKLSDKYK